MAGSLAGEAEVWAGALSGGEFVLALINRGKKKAMIKADLSLLREPNLFFSFSMLSESAAKANGYAYSIDLGPQGSGDSFSVRDILDASDLGTMTGIIESIPS